MNLGKLISKIRKDKNIPVKYLIKGCMSRSTYNYFTEGKTDITAHKFLNLINKLNLSWGEFEYIKRGYNNFSLKLNKEIQPAILCKDINQLKNIKRKLHKRFINLNNIKFNKYFYLYCALDIIITKISNKRIDKRYKTYIKNYLLSRHTWTYYELSLFNDSFFIFNTTLIQIFTKRILKNLRKYKDLTNNENESARLLMNIAIFYIMNKKLPQASKIINDLQNIKLQDNMILEKMLQNYLKGIYTITKRKNDGSKIVKKSLNQFHQLGLSAYYNALNNSYKTVMNLY